MIFICFYTGTKKTDLLIRYSRYSTTHIPKQVNPLALLRTFTHSWNVEVLNFRITRIKQNAFLCFFYLFFYIVFS